MITGGCPYEDCDGPLFIPLEDNRPIEKHACETCKRVIWTLHSRFEPQSWTDEEFRKHYAINDITKEISPL